MGLVLYQSLRHALEVVYAHNVLGWPNQETCDVMRCDVNFRCTSVELTKKTVKATSHEILVNQYIYIYEYDAHKSTYYIIGISPKGARNYFINSLNIKYLFFKNCPVEVIIKKRHLWKKTILLFSLILFVEWALCWINICFLNQHTQPLGMSEAFSQGPSFDVRVFFLELYNITG